jgi:glycosyltransferase involved in cell wall biosynthesis
MAAGGFAVRSRLERERIDIVEAHIAYPTGLIARPVAAALGAPLVLFAHGADVRDLPERSGRHARLAASTLGAATLVVANSEFLAGDIARRFPRVADRVRVLTPGIELDRFAPGPPESRSGVLFVGRLIPQKGADILVEAIARLEPRARGLTVIGDGPERERLMAVATERGVELELRGELGRAETARAMASAAVVAVPSVYEEPLGLVALEGMAAGAIVVASAVGGLCETVIAGQTGVAVPPGDVGALAAALEQALAMAADPPAGAPLRAGARAMAMTHDVRLAARDSLAWYGTLRR